MCNKVDELQLFLYEQNVDICCVTETWFTCDVPNSLFCPKGYAVFRHDRSTPGGDVAIFVKSVMRAAMIDISVKFNHIEILCVCVC